VFFNDSTKIISKPETDTFEYLERRTTEKHDKGVVYTNKDYPKELNKKVTLLQHFKGYLESPTDRI
jgi:polo-like kinase 1